MGGNMDFMSDYFQKLPNDKKTKLSTDQKFTCME